MAEAKDPISAIANAVGKVGGAVFDFLGKKQQTKQIQETRRLNQDAKYQDFFAGNRTNLGNRNLIIIAIMGVMVIGIVVAISLKGKKTATT